MTIAGEPTSVITGAIEDGKAGLSAPGCRTASHGNRPVRMKITWDERDRQRLLEFLDAWFEETADWSHAVADMQLKHQTGQPPYTRMEVQGDFFYEAHLLMKHFGLDCSGKPILVAVDGDNYPSYIPLR